MNGNTKLQQPCTARDGTRHGRPTPKMLVMLIGFGFAAMSSQAFAQDAEPFTGARIAVTGGWDQVDHGGNKGLDYDGQKGSGFTYGGTAGYDLAIGPLRFGPEAEVTGSTQKNCAEEKRGERCESAGRDFYVGGRLGYALGDKALLYTRVGYTNGRFTQAFHPDEPVGTDMPAVAHDDRSGVRAGVGIEYALTPQFFLTSEYRYSNYSGGYSRNQVIGGVGIRF